MYRCIWAFAILMAFETSVALADLPTYPGAKPFGPAQSQPGANIKVDMSGMPGIGAVNSSSKSHSYSLPTTTTFEDIKKFYSAELTKLGYSEKAQVNIAGMGMPTQTASYSSKDGGNTVTLTLTKNPTSANENLLSVSESATSMR